MIDPIAKLPRGWGHRYTRTTHTITSDTQAVVIDQCTCGKLFPAISTTIRKAEKLARGKYRRHFKQATGMCDSCMRNDHEDCRDGNRISRVAYECACAKVRHCQVW